MSQTLLLTGFEPFLDVALNPSGEIARRLNGRILESPGARIEIHGAVLPVSFARAPEAHAEALRRLDEPPVAIVSLGVHRGPEFRLESRAGARFGSGQPDNDGLVGAEIRLPGPEIRETPFDLACCAAWLREAGAASVMVSSDAGGYLCERVFRAGLDVPAAPALFLHIPPVESLGVEDQLPVVLGFLQRLVADL
ncbi:Pyrrolidone-carboxylate peptidase [Planctomycetes bacterium Poly30]|uniref:Pyrrolidone-carboxylate peptidase n=1 Tax=Saltatorellus ferox TaxID=2528018 RepID=A0A518EXS6_9BACT|nr:Pyrrolidone-carboxylate peptidase [Planctomycetes bacterium Poly30]